LISCTPWKDGFELFHDARCIVRHSSRHPGFFLSPIPGTSKNSPTGSLVSRSWKGLGACSIKNEGPDKFFLSFSGGFAVEVTALKELVILAISAIKPDYTALRIYFPLASGEFLFGLAPHEALSLSGKKLSLRTPVDTAQVKPIPTVFSSQAWWLHVPGGIPSDWSFGSTRMEVGFEASVRTIVLGFDESPGGAMESLCGNLAAWKKTESDAKYSGIGYLATQGPVIHLRGSVDDTGEILSTLQKAGVEPGLILRGQDSSLPETLISTLGVQQWNDFITASGYVPVASIPAALSLSFSGAANPFIPFLPQEAGNESNVESLQFLDLAGFGPLCQLSLANPGAYSREFRARLIASLKIFALLKPYREACAREWELKALPALRHPSLEFPASKELWTRKDQLLFGRDLLMAPPIGRLPSTGLRKRKALLPDAEWVHLWTSRHYGGGVVELEDPPGKPVVFFRNESDFAGLFDEIRKKATRF